ncbi:hypothetical protein L2E82_48484 [Cichorium intybus]|uniref:Uncharacterized protein n=1 Tax=Cichorium intybus TaxID=13427 RepID=A0ACB8YYS1_CICIN|nr:hypothetical protein L2E82_48484 [Cichorium intybus]
MLVSTSTFEKKSSNRMAKQPMIFKRFVVMNLVAKMAKGLYMKCDNKSHLVIVLLVRDEKKGELEGENQPSVNICTYVLGYNLHIIELCHRVQPAIHHEDPLAFDGCFSISILSTRWLFRRGVVIRQPVLVDFISATNK